MYSDTMTQNCRYKGTQRHNDAKQRDPETQTQGIHTCRQTYNAQRRGDADAQGRRHTERQRHRGAEKQTKTPSRRNNVT